MKKISLFQVIALFLLALVGAGCGNLDLGDVKTSKDLKPAAKLNQKWTVINFGAPW